MHLENEQHEERAEMDRIVERSVSDYSENPEDVITLKEDHDMKAPLMKKNKRADMSNIKSMLKPMNNGTGFYSTIFIDPNIPKDNQRKTLPVLKQVSGIAKPF